MSRRLLPTEKRARGTFQPCRDAAKVEFLEPETLPVEPGTLTEAGRQIWLDILPHVLATERDSILLGQLANLLGACNSAWAAGAAPPAAHLSEVRRLSELFGLAGRRSRLGVVEPATGAANPFSRHGCLAPPSD